MPFQIHNDLYLWVQLDIIFYEMHLEGYTVILKTVIMQNNFRNSISVVACAVQWHDLKLFSNENAFSVQIGPAGENTGQPEV